MSKILHREMDRLKEQILSLCAMVEGNLALAVRAVEEQNSVLARQAIEADAGVDRAEVRLEEEALKVLALHQPVATDLRFIVATIRINGDMERVGDQAVKIAKRALALANRELAGAGFDFTPMGNKVQSMLRASIDAFVNLDVDTAYDILRSDDEVDAMNRATLDRVKETIRQGGMDVDLMVPLLATSRHLERVADHATNIAEDVIYMVTGDIVRHRGLGTERAARAETEGEAGHGA